MEVWKIIFLSKWVICMFHVNLPGCTLPETNSSHLKMDGWKTSFLLGWPMFMGYVSFREGIHTEKQPDFFVVICSSWIC